jgi:hypothetical protein
VWDLIRMLRLDRVIDCFRGEQEALETFARRQEAR